jgi:hypothetical protein
VVAASGRDGDGGRDDGGGDDGGGGSDPPAPPPQRGAPTPLAVLIARAEARALLWQAGAFDFNTAVDELEAEAEVSGLLAAIGQDEVEAIVAAVFAAVSDDGEPAAVDGWTKAAAEYRAERGKQTLIVETEPERLARLRELMSDAASLERAAYEIAAARRAEREVANATLTTAEHLIGIGDAERLRAWLARRSARERAAILRHIEQRKKVRPCQKKT